VVYAMDVVSQVFGETMDPVSSLSAYSDDVAPGYFNFLNYDL
jgi:hypothetical protein